MSEYISTTEAARMLGVSSVTIFNMIQDGRIKGIKVGRNYIIERATLKENFILEVKQLILPILRKHGVKRAAIFGSMVRGKKKGADLDLLVDPKKGSSLF
ncbi:MAG: excisionase family DNA-binding protein, partial [Candidatus Peregrinibacteria bacterium]|nr:excisionase family DNA-binding protein [Candidatus Peregrinibacteria bacterium]